LEVRRLRNAACLVLVFLFFYACAPKSELPEKVMEDGAEVVHNRIEPYTIEGEPSTFTLEREFAIDTEDDRIAQLGLTDIGLYFDVDSAGNIYLPNYENADSLIFKFDRDGQFIRSFARKGQGPGELVGRNYLSLRITVDKNGNIAVSDFGNKLVFFDGDGRMTEERRIDSSAVSTAPLANGNYLSFLSVMDGRSEFINQNPLMLLDDRFENIKELEKQMIPNPIVGKRLKGSYYVLAWSVANGMIFTGFQERGYEIFAYDLDGNLVRKIKKQFNPVPISEEYKKNFMKQFSAPLFDSIRSKIYFPDAMPPFHAFFADDEGRLFVMTYEKGENPGEFVYDIFDPDGVCTGRKNLKILHDESGIYAKMKNGRFYCLNEKDSGYKELAVSKIVWE
jgi:outer membrane protein assembly factor BamB